MNSDNKTCCPICNKSYTLSEIEEHVNRCIFLNCSDDGQKRKRSPSPNVQVSQSKFNFKQKSPSHSTVQSTSSPSADLQPSQPRFRFKQKSPSNSVTQSTSTTSTQHETEKSAFTSTSCENKPDTFTSKTSQQSKLSKLSFSVPLAKQVQPKSLSDFFGQNKILGTNSVLKSLLEKEEVPNMILWGPPGCGKTSLAGVINGICKKNPKKLKFVSLCAATTGVKEVQNIITIAKNEMKFGRTTVLFMDEIHRFNKRQQDTFLMSVEKGEIILIGATTENPSFIINSALLSRCRVMVFEKLECDDLYSILKKAADALNIDSIDTENPCGIIGADKGIAIEDKALQWLADISDGDARIALSNFQLVIQQHNNDGKIITVDDIRDGIKKSHMLYDRAGEEHYNIISAMHKSIRGSDANAALYWTTRMIVSGEDPRYIARRLVRAASEDIGNADPTALQLAVSTMEGCQLLGMPEADVLLAQCAIYLARAPKSREADSALAKAKELIKGWKGPQPAVPMHIRNAPTRLMKDLGYGRLQNGAEFLFMPPELKDVDFFK